MMSFLPSYSTDFNPSEMAFAKLKALLRAAAGQTVADLRNAIANAVKRLAPDGCKNFFAAAGCDAV